MPRRVWPPRPAPDVLVEPLRSAVHVYVLSGFLGQSALSKEYRLATGDLEHWTLHLRHQLALAAHGDADLVSGLATLLEQVDVDRQSPPRFHLAELKHADSPEEAVATVLRRLLYAVHSGFAQPGHVSSATVWLARWRSLNEVPAPSASELPGPDELLTIRLQMCDESAVRKVTSTMPGLRCGAGGALVGRTDTEWVGAFPGHDGLRVRDLTHRGLLLRHLAGPAELTELQSLGIEPSDHPCGIDGPLSMFGSELSTLAWSHGSESLDWQLAVEWSRHDQWWLGEDEDLVRDGEFPRQALEEALMDSRCIKHDVIHHYLDRWKG